jgi:hypothetical protein
MSRRVTKRQWYAAGGFRNRRRADKRGVWRYFINPQT